ncbi:MAG: hypothetical protein ABJ239_02645 [Erythrobacter sp.]
MKKIALIAALAVVTACSQAADEMEAVEETVEAAGPVALDGEPSTGTYRIVTAEGTEITQEVRADGTYTNTVGEESETGTWEQKSPEVFCSKSDDEEEMGCSTESLTEDGVWQSVDDDGAVSTVERVAEEATAE